MGTQALEGSLGSDVSREGHRAVINRLIHLVSVVGSIRVPDRIDTPPDHIYTTVGTSSPAGVTSATWRP